jgi:hypothetical protein
MGEYATFSRDRVKIGTCEDMYYLRADQAWQVSPEEGSLDPRSADVQKVIRFRFPYPDEDGTPPGAFERYDRSIPLHGVAPPAELDHYPVQFTARAGYLVSLPCPETLPSIPGLSTTNAQGLTIARNGFAGPVHIVQQAYRGGVLALIAECGGCGARYNLPTLADAEPYIVACRAEADRAERRDGAGAGKWWHQVADRIAAGYGAQTGEARAERARPSTPCPPSSSIPAAAPIAPSATRACERSLHTARRGRGSRV